MACTHTAMTGGLFRVRGGLKPTIGGAVLGTLLRYAANVRTPRLSLISNKSTYQRLILCNGPGICEWVF